MRWIVVLAALLWSGTASAQGLGAPRVPGDSPSPGTSFNAPYFGPSWGLGAFLTEQPSAVRISSTLVPGLATTDLGANAHLISDGWTADVTLRAISATTPAYSGGVGNTNTFVGLYSPSYATPNTGTLPSPTSNTMALTDTRPGYACTSGLGSLCSLGTVSTTVYGTVPIRLPFGALGGATDYNAPVSAASGSDMVVSVALSDPIFNGDAIGAVTFASAFYNDGTNGNSPAASVIATTGTLPNYPPPIMSWVTPPGQFFPAASGFTVEVNCVSAAYGATTGSQTCAGVSVTASDGTHSVTRTTNTMAASLLQVSQTGTATNASNCITAMASTDGFNVGDRVTVYGVPGQPTVLTKTSTSLCLGSAQTATFTTGVPGTITLLAPASGNGQAFADGAFVGASIQSPGAVNITLPNTGIATISAASGSTWAFTASQTTLSGANPRFVTAAVLTTTATATVAGTAVVVNILENYQGVTGTVTVYKGAPHWDYQVTFTPTDFSGTITTAGNISFEAIGYPQYGNNPTDSRWGAGAMNVPGDGAPSGTGHTDGCDWFAVNIGSCSGAALFATNGTDASVNLHNLWENDDASYQPIYIPIASTGLCTTSACIQTSATVPATGCTTTCAASPFVVLAAVKAYNNSTNRNGAGPGSTTAHNDLNGAVYCYVSSGSPVTYSGFGGAISGSITAKKPGVILNSVTSAGTCPTYGVAAEDPVNIVWSYSGTSANQTLAGTPYIGGVTITSGTSAPVWCADTAVTVVFPACEFVFNNPIITPTGTQPMLFRIGVWHLLNCQVNQGLFEGDALTVSGGINNSPAEVAFCTIVNGKYNAVPTALWQKFNDFGNISFNGGPVQSPSTATGPTNAQALSTMVLNNKFMNYVGSGILQGQIPVAQIYNFALVNNICEYVVGVSPCMLYGADNSYAPMYNTVDLYNDGIGSRDSHHFAEGVALSNAQAQSSGGSLTCGTTYFYAVTYTNPGGATEDVYDGGNTSQATPACGTNIDTITLKVLPTTLPGSPEGGVRGVYIYLKASTFATGGSVTLATVTGCSQPCTIGSAGATFTLTAISGTSRTLPNVTGGAALAGWYGVGPLRMRQIEHFNLRGQDGLKNDTYVFGTNYWASGARIGTWDGVHGVSKIGNATLIGNIIQGVGAGTGPLGSTGMYAGWGSQPSAIGVTTNFSTFGLVEDRSCGWAGGTTACGNQASGSTSQYGTNLGESRDCLLSTSPAGLNLVAAGYAEWPIDLQGIARRNDGTGTAGAIEGNASGAGGAATCY